MSDCPTVSTPDKRATPDKRVLVRTECLCSEYLLLLIDRFDSIFFFYFLDIGEYTHSFCSDLILARSLDPYPIHSYTLEHRLRDFERCKGSAGWETFIYPACVFFQSRDIGRRNKI